MMFCRFMESSKRYGITPFLDLGSFGQRVSDHIKCMTCGRGTGGKPPGDRTLKCGHQGVAISVMAVR